MGSRARRPERPPPHHLVCERNLGSAGQPQPLVPQRGSPWPVPASFFRTCHFCPGQTTLVPHLQLYHHRDRHRNTAAEALEDARVRSWHRGSATCHTPSRQPAPTVGQMPGTSTLGGLRLGPGQPSTGPGGWTPSQDLVHAAPLEEVATDPCPLQPC